MAGAGGFTGRNAGHPAVVNRRRDSWQAGASSSRTSRSGWGEILAAAALQGATFAVVKAAVDRGGATGVRKATGQWPD